MPYLFLLARRSSDLNFQNTYIVNRVPIRSDPRPKPPPNLNGNEVLLSSGICFGECIKIGSN